MSKRDDLSGLRLDTTHSRAFFDGRTGGSLPDTQAGRDGGRTRTDAESWELLSTDPLAYIRELAYAHAEKLREGAETNVIELNAYRDRRIA